MCSAVLGTFFESAELILVAVPSFGVGPPPDQVIADERTVAAPPESLGAHEAESGRTGRACPGDDLLRRLQPGPFGHGEGVGREALAMPARLAPRLVVFRQDCGEPAPATQLRPLFVRHAVLREPASHLLLAEVGQTARGGVGAYVHDRVEGLAQVEELLHAQDGMPE